MKTRILLIACALLGAAGTAMAQNIVSQGRVIYGPFFDISHQLLFSQNDYIYGTSRTAAMGGAFTSLGADLSSMNINPAGLGMYQSSDWGITQSLSFNKMKTSSDFMPAGTLFSGGNRTSYGLNNISMAYNIFNRSAGLTSLTIGVGYNRMANFNSRSYIDTRGERTSIAEMFQNQLQVMYNDPSNPILPGDLSTSNYPFENLGIYLDEWGAVLGFQSGLVGFNGGQYNMLAGLTPADSYFKSITKGGLFEYTFSLGANINNILYLGGTIGATQVNYREDTTYEEYYTNAPINMMWYDQSTKITGAGFTMKLGAVVRPIPALRVGLAFHLPTFYTLDKAYTSEMNAGGNTFNSGNVLVDQQRFNTAPRLLAGVSYVIASRAVLAVDYECAWYNKMRIRDDDSRDVDASRRKFNNLYKPGHSIRAGIEVRATDVLSVRAGGGYQADFFRQSDNVFSNPSIKSSYTISGGLGFNVGRNAYIDLSYIYKRADYTNYELFYHDDGTNLVSQYDIVNNIDVSREYTPRKNMHMVTLTFGNRF